MVTAEKQCLEEEAIFVGVPSDLSQKFVDYSSKDLYLKKCLEDPTKRRFYSECVDFLKEFLKNYNSMEDARRDLDLYIRIRKMTLKSLRMFSIEIRKQFIGEIKKERASLEYLLTGRFQK